MLLNDEYATKTENIIVLGKLYWKSYESVFSTLNCLRRCDYEILQ